MWPDYSERLRKSYGDLSNAATGWTGGAIRLVDLVLGRRFRALAPSECCHRDEHAVRQVVGKEGARAPRRIRTVEGVHRPAPAVHFDFVRHRWLGGEGYHQPTIASDGSTVAEHAEIHWDDATSLSTSDPRGGGFASRWEAPVLLARVRVTGSGRCAAAFTEWRSRQITPRVARPGLSADGRQVCHPDDRRALPLG